MREEDGGSVNMPFSMYEETVMGYKPYRSSD
jgi:hypothetical protein